MDDVTLTLVDVNPRMVDAWRAVFADEAGVSVVLGSLLAQRADAWVTPTNARAVMSGGVDARVKSHLGPGIQARVRRAVAAAWGDAMPVGAAVCVPTGRLLPSFLVATPTMHGTADDISATLHVALACAAALQAVRAQNLAAPGSIRTVALPGLGAGTGRVEPAVCAELMYAAWGLFDGRSFADFDELRGALAHDLGELGDPAPAPPPRGPRTVAARGPRPAVLPVPFHGTRRSA